MTDDNIPKKTSFDFDYNAAREMLEANFFITEEAANQKQPPIAPAQAVLAVENWVIKLAKHLFLRLRWRG